MFKIELTNDKFDEMLSKHEINNKISDYMLRYHKEFDIGDTHLNKANRLRDCLNYFQWDKYEANKVLDLKRVNRCKDNRYCPNCKKIDLSLAISNFAPKFAEMIDRGYYPYVLTLTTPNVIGEDLKQEISNFSKAFRKFYRWIGDKKERYKDCYITAKACIRVLEITYNMQQNTYNPHYHCILFLEEDITRDFEKYIYGPYRKKSDSYIMFSDLDLQMMQLWYAAINNITKRKFKNLPNNWYDENGNYTGLYITDIQPICSMKGIYEVFKYTFKDTDIVNYNVFCKIYDALRGKRLRQGHGELYNLKMEFEDDEMTKIDDIRDYLEIDKEESPSTLNQCGLQKTISELRIVYHDYKKISRFKASVHDEFIEG